MLASASNGGIVTLQADSLTNLLGDNYTTLDSVLVTDAQAGTLVSSIYSCAYTNDDGLYAYLYQIDHDITSTSRIVDEFSLVFAGADDYISIGYLTHDVSGFLSGGGQPDLTAFVNAYGEEPEISIFFDYRSETELYPGEHSNIIYAISSLSPDLVTGTVWDHDTASGSVIGPSIAVTPEPLTITLLGLGSILLHKKRELWIG
jgi:hypothetical protein